MLALLFDMNVLWEEYILIRLKQVAEEKGFAVYGQNSKAFWKNISIRPDIVLEKDEVKYIIDTKWKNIDYSEPSTHDLRQMYVYNEYWNSTKAMLLYPTHTQSSEIQEQDFVSFHDTPTIKQHHQCSLGKISVFDGDVLDEGVGNKILDWFG